MSFRKSRRSPDLMSKDAREIIEENRLSRLKQSFRKKKRDGKMLCCTTDKKKKMEDDKDRIGDCENSSKILKYGEADSQGSAKEFLRRQLNDLTIQIEELDNKESQIDENMEKNKTKVSKLQAFIDQLNKQNETYLGKKESLSNERKLLKAQSDVVFALLTEKPVIEKPSEKNQEELMEEIDVYIANLEPDL